VQIGAVRIGLRCGLGINADEFILPEKLFLVMFKYVLFGFVVFLTSCTTKDLRESAEGDSSKRGEIPEWFKEQFQDLYK